MNYELWLHLEKDEFQLYKPEYEADKFVYIGEVEADGVINAEATVIDFLSDDDYVTKLREMYA